MHKLFISLIVRRDMAQTAEVIGYCVKCREKRTMKDPESVTLKNGKPATKGICSKCGTNMFRIGKIK